MLLQLSSKVKLISFIERFKQSEASRNGCFFICPKSVYEETFQKKTKRSSYKTEPRLRSYSSKSNGTDNSTCYTYGFGENRYRRRETKCYNHFRQQWQKNKPINNCTNIRFFIGLAVLF